MITGLTSISPVLKFDGPTDRSSYNVSWVFYGFTFLPYGTPAALNVIVIAYIVEWILHKYPWFIRSFNIAVYCIAISLASFVNNFLNPSLTLSNMNGTVGFVAAIVVSTFINHFLVGWVIRLARGQSFKESGVFEATTLLIDITLLGFGVASAMIWMAKPLMALLNFIPLYLLYKALRVTPLQKKIEMLQGEEVDS